MTLHQPSSLIVPPTGLAVARPSITGGLLDPNAALTLMNLWFFVSEVDGEVSISRVENDGSLTNFALDDLRLLLANTFVDVGNKPIPISIFWLNHPLRRTCTVVFEPTGQIQNNEYNLFRGLAMAPSPGYQRQRRLLRHIWRIVCKRDKVKFKYFMRWLAWCVQNPDRHAEVIVVLMSEAEGCGKSTVGQSCSTSLAKGKGGTACW